MNSSPTYLIIDHQAADRINTPNKQCNIAIFDHLDVRKQFCEIDCQRYPKDSVIINYISNEKIDQYRDLKLFYEEYVGEELLNLFVTYLKMKHFYPIQKNDLGFQVDHTNPEKIQVFRDYQNNPANARFFIILTRHRKFEMV